VVHPKASVRWLPTDSSPRCTLARPMEEGPCASWGIPCCRPAVYRTACSAFPERGIAASGPSPEGGHSVGSQGPGARVAGSWAACHTRAAAASVCNDVAARLARPWPASRRRALVSLPRREAKKSPAITPAATPRATSRSRRIDPPSWKPRQQAETKNGARCCAQFAAVSANHPRWRPTPRRHGENGPSESQEAPGQRPGASWEVALPP
jgi:hypothetical protein